MTAPLLEVRGLSKRFGGLQAVGDVSFDVRPGTVKAVIGPNGAGKTTLFNLISGVTAPDAGAVTFQGRAIQGRPPHEVAGLGLSRTFKAARVGGARTFQNLQLFSGMTALENVMVGRHLRSRAGFLAGMLHLPATWREERALAERAREALAFLELDGVADAEATSLSYGQQRGVELAGGPALPGGQAAGPGLRLGLLPMPGPQVSQQIEGGMLFRIGGVVHAPQSASHNLLAK